jgi:hypothetical protein
VIVGSELTLAGPRGYFVDVPLHKDSDYRSISLGRVKWPKQNGMSGPIGSINVP